MTAPFVSIIFGHAGEAQRWAHLTTGTIGWLWHEFVEKKKHMPNDQKNQNPARKGTPGVRLPDQLVDMKRYGRILASTIGAETLKLMATKSDFAHITGNIIFPGETFNAPTVFLQSHAVELNKQRPEDATQPFNVSFLPGVFHADDPARMAAALQDTLTMRQEPA